MLHWSIPRLAFVSLKGALEFQLYEMGTAEAGGILTEHISIVVLVPIATAWRVLSRWKRRLALVEDSFTCVE